MNVIYIVTYAKQVDKVFSDLETAQHYLSARVLESDVPEQWALTAHPIERRQLPRAPW